MDLTGRPLLDTKPDHALFAGREAELEHVLRSVERRLNVLLIGPRGSGKTTLLRQLAFELRQRHPNDKPPGFVDGRLSEDVKTFIDLVRLSLGLPPAVVQPSPMEMAMSAASRMRARKAAIDQTLELPRLLASLTEAEKDGRRAVLVDELPTKSVGETVFGRLRDSLWRLPLTWVVAATDHDAALLQSPPADAFFDVVVHLQPLSKKSQRAILEARAGRSGRRIASRIDEGSPRRLLAVAREVLEQGEARPDLWRALARRDAEVSKLGRSASMLMAELESLGPSSASDETLLQRLGWTRPRAVQVLRQLENAGFVTSATVKGEAGRPRKVYRPVEPLEPPTPTSEEFEK